MIVYAAENVSNILKARKLQCGDHVSWPTDMSSKLRHHAIVLAYKGEDIIRVIHATPKVPGSEQYEVREDGVDVGGYIKERSLKLHEYGPDECYDQLEVVDRARSMIGPFAYNEWDNNCEHFARWCKTGDFKSEQAEKWRRKIKKAIHSGLQTSANGARGSGGSGPTLGILIDIADKLLGDD